MQRRRVPKRGKEGRGSILRAAPGNLGNVQAFVNTAAYDDEVDVLATPEGLRRWLLRRGLLDGGASIDEEDRRRVLETRRGLLQLIAANSGGGTVPEAVGRLQELASDGRLVLRFDDGGPIGAAPARGSVGDAVGTLLSYVAEARHAGIWPQLKLCARRDCRRAFFDTSRTRNARWCTVNCGARVRGRAYRKTGKYTSRRFNY